MGGGRIAGAPEFQSGVAERQYGPADLDRAGPGFDVRADSCGRRSRGRAGERRVWLAPRAAWLIRPLLGDRPPAGVVAIADASSCFFVLLPLQVALKHGLNALFWWQAKRSLPHFLHGARQVEQIFLGCFFENGKRAEECNVEPRRFFGSQPVIKQDHGRLQFDSQREGFDFSGIQVSLWSEKRSVGLPGFQPVRMIRRPIFDLQRSLWMLQFVEDRLWDDDLAEKFFQDMNFFNFDKITDRRCVGDDDYLPKMAAAVARSLSQSSGASFCRTS